MILEIESTRDFEIVVFCFYRIGKDWIFYGRRVCFYIIDRDLIYDGIMNL